MLFLRNSPLEQEEVDIIVALGEEVPQNTGGITTADLIGRQSEVDALHKIPHLSHSVLDETPVKNTHSGQMTRLVSDGKLRTLHTNQTQIRKNIINVI